MLPGPATVAVLAVVLILVAGMSVWRALAGTAGAGGQETAAASGASQSGQGLPGDPEARTSSSGRDPSGAPSPADLVIVYVTGRVGSPGVVSLPTGSRVVDAVTAAGGPLSDADLAAVNMARLVVDGEHIQVTRPGETPQEPVPGGRAATGADGDPGMAVACVDLNTADQTALETLDGVGPALAGRILSYRNQVGSIASADQLDEVPGIGPALVQRIAAGACP
ncbi:helix-hairpin-helix domain-containing protein [Schaalia naturae]|uniref:helix-hairpin-helix domain-containing protein n=1 Tax=Schaalia naturae TaxID=635203 RepID=UPI0036D360F0